MSVAYTEQAVRDRTKTVTRRLGWDHARPGQRLVLCRKVMGRKKGDPLVRIVVVQVAAVRRERLGLLLEHRAYGLAECEREGFPELNPETFVQRYFTEAQGAKLDALVTRLQWDYCEAACVKCGLDVSESWQGTDEWAASRYCPACLLGPVPAPVVAW